MGGKCSIKSLTILKKNEKKKKTFFGHIGGWGGSQGARPHRKGWVGLDEHIQELKKKKSYCDVLSFNMNKQTNTLTI